MMEFFTYNTESSTILERQLICDKWSKLIKNDDLKKSNSSIHPFVVYQSDIGKFRDLQDGSASFVPLTQRDIFKLTKMHGISRHPLLRKALLNSAILRKYFDNCVLPSLLDCTVYFVTLSSRAYQKICTPGGPSIRTLKIGKRNPG